MPRKIKYQDILDAAKAHGENSEPEHEVGDLQEMLALAYNTMTREQREKFLGRAAVRELVERELDGEGPVETEEEHQEAIWQDDSLQFPRLIAEINANVMIRPKDFKDLCESMDLTPDLVKELFDRADTAWENHKRVVCPPREG